MRLANVLARLLVVLLLLVAAPRFARAQCGRWEEDDRPCEQPYVAWSWLPELSAFASYDETGRERSLFGAELRVRYNSPRHTPGRIYTVGLGVESYAQQTLEPYLALGLGSLSQFCDGCDGDGESFGAVHFALGGGMRFTHEDRERFVLARLSLGLVFSQPHGHYIAIDGERGEVGATRQKLRSQLDLVLETTIDFDGQYRIGLGVAFDPIWLILDLAAMVW